MNQKTVPQIIRAPFTLILLSVVLVSATPATAQNTISGQTTINQPGTWILPQDLVVNCNGSPLIEITSDGVDLDLRGSRLDCLDDNAPLIRATAAGHLSIQNGRLDGGSQQSKPLIELEPPLSAPTRHYHLEELDLRDFETGISVIGTGALRPASVEITDCNLTSLTGKEGISVEDVSSVVIADTLIRIEGENRQNTDAGIDIDSATLVDLRRNQIIGAYRGVRLRNVEGGLVERNNLRSCNRGISIDNSDAIAVVANTMSCSPECWEGILVDDGSNENSLDDNQILGYSFGIFLQSSHNQFSGNRLITQGPSVAIIDNGGNLDGGNNVH